MLAVVAPYLGHLGLQGHSLLLLFLDHLLKVVDVLFQLHYHQFLIAVLGFGSLIDSLQLSLRLLYVIQDENVLVL